MDALSLNELFCCKVGHTNLQSGWASPISISFIDSITPTAAANQHYPSSLTCRFCTICRHDHDGDGVRGCFIMKCVMKAKCHGRSKEGLEACHNRVRYQITRYKKVMFECGEYDVSASF